MTAARTFRIRAHAKINLSLRVGAVQADGYHPLQTVFQSLALHDTLEVTPRQGPFTLTCNDPGVPVDGRNLVTRAALALWTALGRAGEPRDVAVHLSKQIPMQAGLGGGSSDAASALSALAGVWRPRGTRPDLATLAAGLGFGRAVLLRGRHGAGTFEGGGPLSTRRPSGVRCRAGPARVRRRHGGRLPLVRRRRLPAGRWIARRPQCHPGVARPPAGACQRPRGPGHAPASGHRRGPARARDVRCRGGRDDGQRVGGVRALHEGAGCPPGRPGGSGGRFCRPAHPNR